MLKFCNAYIFYIYMHQSICVYGRQFVDNVFVMITFKANMNSYVLRIACKRGL